MELQSFGNTGWVLSPEWEVAKRNLKMQKAIPFEPPKATTGAENGSFRKNYMGGPMRWLSVKTPAESSFGDPHCEKYHTLSPCTMNSHVHTGIQASEK